MKQDRFWVVVPAAGRGTRVGAPLPKQYLTLAGRPLIEHTLRRLAAHPRVAGLMVVLSPDDRDWPGWSALEDKPLLTTEGGAERADSVLAGLQALPQDVAAAHFVLVHDAARPCLRHADLDALLNAAESGEGALLAQPLTDTVKRADRSGHVETTLPREALWRALTPQTFRRGALIAALREAAAAGVPITDEAMAMERAGVPVRLVAGAADNIKVTTPQDVALAEFLLRNPHP